MGSRKLLKVSLSLLVLLIMVAYIVLAVKYPIILFLSICSFILFLAFIPVYLVIDEIVERRQKNETS